MSDIFTKTLVEKVGIDIVFDVVKDLKYDTQIVEQACKLFPAYQILEYFNTTDDKLMAKSIYNVMSETTHFIIDPSGHKWEEILIQSEAEKNKKQKNQLSWHDGKIKKPQLPHIAKRVQIGRIFGGEMTWDTGTGLYMDHLVEWNDDIDGIQLETNDVFVYHDGYYRSIDDEELVCRVAL